jgi:hypothetical protein
MHWYMYSMLGWTVWYGEYCTQYKACMVKFSAELAIMLFVSVSSCFHHKGFQLGVLVILLRVPCWTSCTMVMIFLSRRAVLFILSGQICVDDEGFLRGLLFCLRILLRRLIVRLKVSCWLLVMLQVFCLTFNAPDCLLVLLI